MRQIQYTPVIRATIVFGMIKCIRDKPEWIAARTQFKVLALLVGLPNSLLSG